MNLVDYSDSSDDDGGATTQSSAQGAKRQKLSSDAALNRLPPLPAGFLDQYSSTVRTSTQDDPSLHAGRERVIQHTPGRYPTHVYLEWHPSPTEVELLSKVVRVAQKRATPSGGPDNTVHSSLENVLGVAQPLHVSLCRPLSLRAAQRDLFATALQDTLGKAGIREFDVTPGDVVWHANESSTRWFMVLRLSKPQADELRRLLSTCNELCGTFGQPLLYDSANLEPEALNDKFHISIAWSLQGPQGRNESDAREVSQIIDGVRSAIPDELLAATTQLRIPFSQVKVRIGQDVHVFDLKKNRQTGSSLS